jgi:hypothetical protein
MSHIDFVPIMPIGENNDKVGWSCQLPVISSKQIGIGIGIGSRNRWQYGKNIGIGAENIGIDGRRAVKS